MAGEVRLDVMDADEREPIRGHAATFDDESVVSLLCCSPPPIAFFPDLEAHRYGVHRDVDVDCWGNICLPARTEEVILVVRSSEVGDPKRRHSRLGVVDCRSHLNRGTVAGWVAVREPGRHQLAIFPSQSPTISDPDQSATP